MLRQGLLVLSLFACSTPDPGPPSFPLAEGHRWRYRIELRRGDLRQEQRALVRNLGPARLEGGREALAQWVNGSIHYYLYLDHGLYLQRQPRRAGLFLPLPATAGASWKEMSRTRLLSIRKKALEAPDSTFRLAIEVRYRSTTTGADVISPAGEFRDCLGVEGKGEREIEGPYPDHPIHIRLHSRRWFCPGTGLVRSELEESSDSGFLNDGREILTLLDHHPP